jgi:flavodoxin
LKNKPEKVQKMKSLIIYSSKSGNTRKLADAVRSFLPGEKICKSVEEEPETDGFDLICVGFWFQSGKADLASAKLLQKLDSQAPLFIFATHGAAVESNHARDGMKQAKELAASCSVIGTFSCQGEVSPGMLAKAQSMDQPPAWIKDAPRAVGHPDGEDINELGEILQKVLRSL